MSFDNTISDICGVELASLFSGGKYSVYSNRFVVVEGHKGICHFGKSEMIFNFGKSKLVIVGSELRLKCLSGGFAIVEGVVKAVSVDE